MSKVGKLNNLSSKHFRFKSCLWISKFWAWSASNWQFSNNFLIKVFIHLKKAEFFNLCPTFVYIKVPKVGGRDSICSSSFLSPSNIETNWQKYSCCLVSMWIYNIKSLWLWILELTLPVQMFCFLGSNQLPTNELLSKIIQFLSPEICVVCEINFLSNHMLEC